MTLNELKLYLKRFWNFIWNDDSLFSWLVNLVLAFVLVKFIIYPGLGILLGTSYPVVAVVSGSMEHRGYDFEGWWSLNKDKYGSFNISKDDFSHYKFLNGFNKGDLMILVGPKHIQKGDVIVFSGDVGQPIIHRVVLFDAEHKPVFIQTKGDNNFGSRADEIGILETHLLGKAAYRIPYLGWFKLALVELFSKSM